jgi:predicted ATPase/DNA-binding CsgD family transcriptional regulator
VGRHLSNLPAEVTSFVGRRQELREVKRLLTTTRLLTLTGSGGAGKTKLALRAAAEMSRGFPDGACLVLLGSVRDPLLVTQAVFGALGVHDLSSGMSLSSLTDYLADKRLLLVLDNCEHLLDACAVLASTLLAAGPDLHVLATSRQALGVAGEVRMVVPPMSLPAAGEDTSVQQLLGYDAVWLLSERAAAVLPGFTVDAANAAQVLALCRKLDGIPLALELAAVRLASLSLDQLNRGLAGELSILGTANRGAEARQQTLEATISWSYGLLDEKERLLWARLSVFAGGFQEDAAIAVCADPQIPAGRLVGLLGSLVDKSVLKLQLPSGGPPRYWLLETMRQYGLARLGVAAVPRWFDGDLVGATEQIESALSLARLMHLDQVELNTLNGLCSLLVTRGKLHRAVDVGEHRLTLSQDRGELWMRGYLLTFLAQAAWRRGDRRHAETLAREAATCKRMIDDRNGLTGVLATLAWMAAECRRPGRAATLLGCAERVHGQSAMTLMDVYRPQHDQSVTAAVHAMGEKAFAAAFARGRAMTIDEGVAFAVADEQPSKPSSPVKTVSDTALTSRQLEIARLIAADLTNRQIADRLFLSERTVETHITNMLNKLGLNSRVQLSRWLAEGA